MAYPVSSSGTFPNANFTTNPAYSGSFIPTVWSAKINEKFYATSVFGDISNTDYQGDISGVGDKVIINNAPTITVSDYVAGTALSYQIPVPSTQELLIDKGKYFAFQLNDVLRHESMVNQLEVFSSNAAEQMRVAMDAEVLYGVFDQAKAVANKGATAGVKSGSFNLGTDASPISLNATAGDAANVLKKILELASVLDEQNVPDSDRWLVIDPLTRTLLMQTNIAQAYITGDTSSPLRNGLIGKIDRFNIYVSNQLPYGAAGTTPTSNWYSGDGALSSKTAAGTSAKRRAIIAGHKSAITFASQITKMETVRNPNDFGDFVRSLNVYGYKVVKPEALALLIAA